MKLLKLSSELFFLPDMGYSKKKQSWGNVSVFSGRARSFTRFSRWSRISVNYVELFETIKKIFTGQRFNMIEAAADTIAVGILERFAKVLSVTVEVKKPSVPVDCVCDYFAAEVTRCR